MNKNNNMAIVLDFGLKKLKKIKTIIINMYMLLIYSTKLLY